MLVAALAVLSQDAGRAIAVQPASGSPGSIAVTNPSADPTAAATMAIWIPPADAYPTAAASNVPEWERQVTPAMNPAPLPKCSAGETPVAYPSLDDWQLTLLDTNMTVGRDYVPKDLVPAYNFGFSSRSARVRAVMGPDLLALNQAAASAGARLEIISAYRSYLDQAGTFAHWVGQAGLAHAEEISARPGHSEHQLGLAIDFNTEGAPKPWLDWSWVNSTTGRWLATNAWKYGFIMSYPKNGTAKTCYWWEPWHFRYVGRSEAAAVHNSGLTLREWLWARQPDPRGTPTPFPW
jgi:D-alanyl-D-alanine carboxypeptidase